MKTIYINGRFLSHTVTGVQRYSLELLREFDQILDELHSDIKVELLVPSVVSDLPSYQHVSVRKIGSLSGHAWEQIELPLYSFSGVLFTPGGGAPLLHPRNIVTIHDAAVFAAPAGYTYLYRTWCKFMYRILCTTAVHVLTVSEFSKRELIRWCNARPEKISVNYSGNEHIKRIAKDDSILSKYALSRRGYILAVSSRNPNKNFNGILASLKYLSMPEVEVVIAGQPLNRIFPKYVLESANVKDVGYVNEQELRSLYENAGCFVFSSLYEGFGLPPLEALSVGCPIVVSNAASMPEIYEGAALFFDPCDPVDIADKVRRALSSPEDALLREAMLAKTATYTWKRCAQKAWGLLFAAAKPTVS